MPKVIAANRICLCWLDLIIASCDHDALIIVSTGHC